MNPEDRADEVADPAQPNGGDEPPLLMPAPLTTSPELPPLAAPPRRRWLLPLVLFVATCLSTYWLGGSVYAIPLMLILGAHEMGHFLQAWRYRVPASFPYFIPMPLSPIGTMGAVIAMRGRVADRRALFDIAITGPIAGLVPAVVLTVVGLKLSRVVSLEGIRGIPILGEPLLFKLLAYWIYGPLGDEVDILLHPIGFAGWVGIFITALNLIPIGQLDGGHILYALLRRKAHPVAVMLLGTAAASVVVLSVWNPSVWGWLVMITLLFVMGPKHPPTADDHVPLGRWRVLLGWLILLFVPLGFTPTPFMFRR